MTNTENNVAAQAGDEPMPCPFCQCDQVSVDAYDVQPDNFHSAFAECANCGARGPNALTIDGWLPSKEEAIDEAITAWNRIARPESEPTEAYWAVAPNGARCAFGRYGFAKAWAGKNGTVETVQLRQFTLIEPEVSPRATADVERDAARYRWLRDQCPDFEAMTSYWIYDELDQKIDAAIATTKPGA